MASKYFFLLVTAFCFLFACSGEIPVESKKPAPAPTVVLKPKPLLMSAAERVELGFPARMMSDIESAAGARAEPFFVVVLVRSENLKGDKGYENNKLAGFSVRTKNADDLITSVSRSLRRQGYLIFRSKKNYGDMPDVVTVVKGSNSYDILKIQKTEAPNYHLETGAIITWLKSMQKLAPFVITGAGADRVEGRFIKPPNDMKSFAKKIAAFAPDTLSHGKGTIDHLIKQMTKNNGFFLVWD